MQPILIATPTYNESGNIGRLLDELLALGLDADIMVIDDGSTDGTADIVTGFAARHANVALLQRGSKLGVGSAHLRALLNAKDNGYQTLVTLDADFSHQPADIPRLLAAMPGHAVVLGTRFADAGSLSEWSAFRKAITHLGHALTQLLLAIPYDASGGLRVYAMRSLSRPLLTSITAQDYEFFFESITAIHEEGLRIGEVPIRLPARTYGHSKMQLRHAFKGLMRLFALSAKLAGQRARRREAAAQRSSING
jgi:dolichol-phosphate mannosyltransferase